MGMTSSADMRQTTLLLIAINCLLPSSGLLCPRAAEASSSQQEFGQVEVEVRTGTGQRIPDLYAAIVSEQERWSAPQREELFPMGRSFAWRQVTGRYRMVTSAPGYTIRYSDPFEIEGGKTIRLDIELAPLVRVPGQLIDQAGKPVARGRIGRLRAFLHDFGLRLSPLGEKHLAENFSTITDREGRFQLAMAPAMGHLIAVEARGFAPRIFQQLNLENAATRLASVVLSPGSSLRVKWTASEEASPSYDRLVLVPIVSPPNNALSLELQTALLSRPRSGKSQEWPSLTPGTYELWLRGPPHDNGWLTPVTLRRVELSAGQQLHLDLGHFAKFLPRSGVKSSAKNPALSILLVSSSSSWRGKVQVEEWSADGAKPVESRVVPVSGGLRVELTRCHPGSRYRVISLRNLAVTPPVSCTSPVEEIRIHNFTPGQLSGRVRPPEGGLVPPQLLVTVRPCAEQHRPAQDSGPLGEFPALINNDGIFEATIPAGCVEGLLLVGSFAAHPWGPKTLNVGQSAELGSIALEHGNTILARIVDSVDHHPIAGVEVGVTPATAPSPSRKPVSPEVQTVSSEQTSNEHGWVRITGIPNGEFALRMQAPERHFAVFSPPFAVAGRQEAILPEVELAAASVLEVQIEQADRWFDKEAIPLAVYAERIDQTTNGEPRQLRAEITGDLMARFAEIVPGNWRLTGVIDLGGQRSPAGQTVVEIEPGETHRISLALSDLIFAGEVLLDEEPIEGILTLVPTPLDGRRKMTVRTDTEGRFTVSIERAGRYRVEISDREGRFKRAIVRGLELEDPDEPVIIRLPSGRIAGHVIAPPGVPLPAQLTIRQSDDSISALGHIERRVHSNEDGLFEFEALGEGDWTLTATAGKLRSRPRTFHLTANELLKGLEVRLSKEKQLHGIVISAQGEPVDGAKGLVFLPLSAPGEEVVQPRWTTARSGRFEFDSLGREGELVSIQVIAPDGTAMATVGRLDEGMEIRLPATTGEVILNLQNGSWRDFPPPPLWLVTKNGALLSPLSAGRIQPESANESQLVISKLATGSWRIVRVESTIQAQLLLSRQMISLPTEAQFLVKPGSSLSIDLAQSTQDKPNSNSRQED